MKKDNLDSELELFAKNSLLDIKLSYSKLSSFDQDGPKSLIKRKKLKGEGIDMGGLIDTLLFTPKELKKEYYIFDGSKPTATTGDLVDIILENYSEIPDTNTVLEIIKKNNFWGSVKKEDTLIKKFDTDDFWGFLKAEYESKGKKIVTTEQIQHAEEVVEVLQNHSHSKLIVAYPAKHESKYAQYPFEFVSGDVVFRGLIDLLVVDHKEKTIRIVDLKTGAPSAGEFSKSFIKYRYYFQSGIYQRALGKIMKDLKLEGYTPLPFQFLYISRYEKIPLVYTVTDKWDIASMVGFTTTGGYRYKGINEVVSDIRWHWNNQKFDFGREIYEQEGSLILKDDFIEVG